MGGWVGGSTDDRNDRTPTPHLPPTHPRPQKQQVDQQLPGTLGMFITCVLQILGAMAAVLTATPAFALAVFPLSWVRMAYTYVCVKC